MDIKTYISSGKLELFVLGELSEREREEVLTMAKLHPEIQDELDQIEEAMFNFDNLSGPAPSDEVKNKIFASLEEDFAPQNQERKISPVPVAESQTIIAKLNPWKTYTVAASLVAFLAIGAAIFYANKYTTVESQLTALVQQNTQLAEDLQTNQVKMESLDIQMDQLLSGNFERVFMKGEGLPTQEDARVDVFWDRNSQEVLLSVNILAALDSESDYQLWAIGADGPVGIGIVNPEDKLTLQAMQDAGDAAAFAITIEPKGGSVKPNLEKLVVLGEV
ncbi:anti-sigma factor [Lunatibacter salilacus]|uniref:anti-sigma factor n=1 Tax=Lunatibacter salilacus TaxID=2483804 RepID=UPI00131E07A0|nr:anti-sigma factor [Lunatibacter salilacus]